MKLRKIFAFTLAEVLITLSILGVVAAITVPSLINKNTEKQTVTKVKKAYSTMAEAYEQLIVTDGPASKWKDSAKTTVENDAIMAKKFMPLLMVSKDCETASGCLKPGDPYQLNGGTYPANYDKSGFYKVILKDGATWQFDNHSATANIMVDIDGPKGAHTFGKDIFFFFLTDKGVVPRTSPTIPDGVPNENLSSVCSKTQNSYGCAGWVVYKGNMDYLRKNISW